MRVLAEGEGEQSLINHRKRKRNFIPTTKVAMFRLFSSLFILLEQIERFFFFFFVFSNARLRIGIRFAQVDNDRFQGKSAW